MMQAVGTHRPQQAPSSFCRVYPCNTTHVSAVCEVTLKDKHQREIAVHSKVYVFLENIFHSASEWKEPQKMMHTVCARGGGYVERVFLGSEG